MPYPPHDYDFQCAIFFQIRLVYIVISNSPRALGFNDFAILTT